MVQLYNAGNSVGVDGWGGQILYPTTSDYIIGLTEAVILGYDVKLSGMQNEHFTGLPASKVAVGLPSCANAGGKYTDTNKVRRAMKYLTGIGPKPESYTLKTVGGYPDLGGFMTWSIQKDANCTTTPKYSFARNYRAIYGGVGVSEQENQATNFSVYPNPASSTFTISLESTQLSSTLQILDVSGAVLYERIISQQQEVIDISKYSSGIYFIKTASFVEKLIVE